MKRALHSSIGQLNQSAKEKRSICQIELAVYQGCTKVHSLKVSILVFSISSSLLALVFLFLFLL